jgi:hypothetical protein
MESLLEEATALETDFPLQWIFSVSPLLEQTSRTLNNLLLEIRTRSGSRRDCLVPAGFRGAVHPLLTAEELEKELTWCWSHPAAAGFSELFAAAPAAVMPSYPDPWRELAAGVYSRRGFKALGLPQDPARPYHFLRRGRDARAAIFMYIPLSASSREDFDRRIFSLPAAVPAREKTLFVVLDTASLLVLREQDGEPRPLVGKLLDVLGSKYAVTPISLSDPRLFSPVPKAPGSLDYLPVRADPLRRRMWLQAEPLRSKEVRKDKDLRSILELISDEPDHRPPARKKAPTQDQRVLDANMTGTVVLSGECFDANFTDGRLTGLSSGKQPLFGAGPAQVYLELAGNRYDYRTESAFSFQGPGEYGLRTVFKLNLPRTAVSRTAAPRAESLLVADCYFREDSPDLLLDFRLTYPELEEKNEITAIAPYEIPLLAAAPGEALCVRARFPERDEVEHRFSPDGAPTGAELRQLSGSEFILDVGGQRLFLRFHNSPRIGLMEFCRRRRGGTQYLYANLNGSYRAGGAAGTSGMRESFSFQMGLLP